MNPGALICFIGTDGSGKSTLTGIISKELAKNKVKVRSTYGRHKYFFSRLAILLGKRTLLKGHDPFLNYESYLNRKRNVYKKFSKMIKIYTFMLMLEYVIQVFFKIIIPMKLGYVVVADRYLYDTVINDIGVDSNMSLFEIMEIYNRYENYLPPPLVTFLIQIPEETAMQRKTDIPSINYIRIRNDLYSEFSKNKEVILLDGTLPLEDLKRNILTILSQKLDLDLE